MRSAIAVLLTAALALGYAGCIIEPDEPPSPTVRNDTVHDVWIGAENGTGGNVALRGRVDAEATATVRAACRSEGEVLVLGGWSGGKTREELAAEGIDVLYAYDAVQNPPLCGEAHPDAVWVWDGRELTFTEDD